MSAVDIARPPSAQRMSTGLGLDDLGLFSATASAPSQETVTGDLIDFGAFDDDNGATVSPTAERDESAARFAKDCESYGPLGAFLREIRTSEPALERAEGDVASALHVYDCVRTALNIAIERGNTDGFAALFSIFPPADCIQNEAPCRSLAVAAAAMCATSTDPQEWRQALISAIGCRSPLSVVYKQALEECDLPAEGRKRADWHKECTNIATASRRETGSVDAAVVGIAGCVHSYNSAASKGSVVAAVAAKIDADIEAAAKELNAANNGTTNVFTAVPPAAWICFNDVAGASERLNRGRTYAVLRFLAKHWEVPKKGHKSDVSLSAGEIDAVKAKVSRVVGDPDCLDLFEAAIPALTKIEKAASGKEE